MGSTRPRHHGNVRAKHEGGMAVDNGAGGWMAWLWSMDRSMRMQRACSSGGVMDATVRACGEQWWRCMGCNNGDTWGAMVVAHGA